jgi:DNA-directed RNA polymerase alpha subunit
VSDAVVSERWRELGLRTMTANALTAAGIATIEQLRAHSKLQLLILPQIGKLGMEDIAKLLLRQEETDVLHVSQLGDDVLVMELLRRGYTVAYGHKANGNDQ